MQESRFAHCSDTISIWWFPHTRPCVGVLLPHIFHFALAPIVRRQKKMEIRREKLWRSLFRWRVAGAAAALFAPRVNGGHNVERNEWESREKAAWLDTHTRGPLRMHGHTQSQGIADQKAMPYSTLCINAVRQCSLCAIRAPVCVCVPVHASDSRRVGWSKLPSIMKWWQPLYMRLCLRWCAVPRYYNHAIQSVWFSICVVVPFAHRRRL